MKFTRKKNAINSIRKVWNDDKTICYGVVGIVEDLLEEGILDWCEYDHNLYLFLAAPGIMQQDHFGKTRDEAIKLLPV